MPRRLSRALLCSALRGRARRRTRGRVPGRRLPALQRAGICTAQVPSFDGAPLDADLTLPAGPPPRGGGHPLIVLLHGFGGDKHDWQSTDGTADGRDKWRWNSHWFAKRGSLAPADHDVVNPSIPFWGGPTGVVGTTTTGAKVLSYGNSRCVAASSS